MTKPRNEPPADALDRALATVEHGSLGQLLTAAGQQAQPRPEFVAQLRARLQQRARSAPARGRWPAAWHRGRPLALAGAALALLVVLAGLVGLAQPAPVSAAQVLAWAAGPPAVQSLHGVLMGQHRKSTGEALTAVQAEVWYLAPAHIRFAETAPGGPPGGAPHWELSDGTSNWSYDAASGAVEIWDEDPAQSNLFAASSLSQVLQATNHGQYDAMLLPPETIAGHAAYVLDLTAQPGAGVVMPHSRLWVDQQTYLPLRQDDWDAAGNLLATTTWRSLELNPALDPAIFVFVPPAGVSVVDKRVPGGPAAQAAQWQQVARPAGFAVFRPAAAWGSLASVEYSPALRQVTARGTAQLQDSTAPELRIREGRPADLPLPRPGTPVAAGDLRGEYQAGSDWASLSLERDGTRILVQTPAGPRAQALLIKTAQSLQPVSAK